MVRCLVGSDNDADRGQALTPAIISLPRSQRRLAARLLPDDAHDAIAGADRVYLLYFVAGRSSDAAFVDPIDGELLIAVNYFTSESAARAWVAADIALRAARTKGVQ